MGTEPKYQVRDGIGSPIALQTSCAFEPILAGTIGSGTIISGRTIKQKIIMVSLLFSPSLT